MRRAGAALVSFAAFLFILTACGGGNPEDAVKGYLEGLKAFDAEQMNRYVKDGADLNFEEEMETASPAEQMMVSYIKDNVTKITYEVQDSEVIGETASVTAHLTYPDNSRIFQNAIAETIREGLAAAFTGGDSDEETIQNVFIEAFQKNLTESELQFSETTIVFPCIKIEGKWFIEQIGDEVVNMATGNLAQPFEEYEEIFPDMESA